MPSPRDRRIFTDETLNSYWFLFSLAPLLGFLVAELALTFHGSRITPTDKTFEIKLFYATCLMAAALVFLFKDRLLQVRHASGGRVQTLCLLMLIIHWANNFDRRHVVLTTNGLVLLVLLVVTIPTVLGVSRWLKIAEKISKIFPEALLGLGTAAVLSVCTSPAKEKVIIPLIYGFAAVLLLKLVTRPSVSAALLNLKERVPQSLCFFMGLLILIVSFPGKLTIDYYHLLSIVGPALQDRMGHSAMVDIDSMYGLANIWFLGAVFKLLGGATLAKAYYLNYLIRLVSFIAVAYLVRVFTGSRFAALFALFIATAYGVWPYLPQVYSYYSLGPFRFGSFLILLALVLLREKYPNRKWDFIEAATIGFCSIWSMEVAAFTLVPYLALLIYENRWKVMLPKVVISIFVFAGLAELRIWIYTQQFADPRRYWEWVGVNVVEGASSMFMQIYGAWIPMWLLLTTSLGLCALSFLQKRKDSILLISTMSFFITISYFVNRSIDAIFLSHAPVLAVLLIYYLYFIIPRRYLVHGAILAFMISIFYLQGDAGTGQPQSPVYKQVQDNVKNLFTPHSLTDNPYCSNFNNEFNLIRKYSDSSGRAFILSGPQGEVYDFMAAICAGITNAFELNPSAVTTENPRASQFKVDLALTPGLVKKGTVIIIDNEYLDPEKAPTRAVSYKIFHSLEGLFRFVPLETVGELTAVRAE